PARTNESSRLGAAASQLQPIRSVPAVCPHALRLPPPLTRCAAPFLLLRDGALPAWPSGQDSHSRDVPLRPAACESLPSCSARPAFPLRASVAAPHEP